MATCPDPVVPARAIGHVYTTWDGYDMPNLDFMRALAVLLVLFGHLFYYLGITDFGPFKTTWMGILGVKIFFVHTCFVLMLSLERQWKNQAPTELFSSFMIRRIFRIYPLSLCVVSLIVALRLPLAELNPGRFVAMPLHPSLIVSNLLLVQSSRYSILGPTWSLPYELAMYLSLPWLFLLLYPNKSLGRATWMWLLSLGGALVLLFAGRPNSNSFFLYVPCFLPGVVAYQLQRTRRQQLPGRLWPGVVIGIILLFLYNQDLVSNPWFKSWTVCLALGASVPFFSQISAPWLRVPSHLIAKYSYGIYLTHFFSIWLAFHRLHDILPRIVRLPVFVVLVTLLPIVFYHCLEEPMTLLGKRIANRFEKRARTSYA